ncbi:MAG: hypothetical protein GX335_07890 [Firmicutes bacterium]|nr:hypothetical protein [Bacillota bacterium]
MLLEADLSFKRVILVCKAFHSRRALLSYQRYFPTETKFSVLPVPDQMGHTKDN